MSVAADREIGAGAGKRHNAGFFHRPADDLAELTDHFPGEGIPCRGTLDHDRANAILDVELKHSVRLGPIGAAGIVQHTELTDRLTMHRIAETPRRDRVMKLRTRRNFVIVEERFEEAGRVADQRLRRVAAVAVMENPYAGATSRI